MLEVTPQIIDTIKSFLEKRWRNKDVSCSNNIVTQCDNRYITIPTLVDETIAHYKYSNGYFQLCLVGDYYRNEFNYGLYRYLRNEVDTSTGDYRWHSSEGMKQGCLTYEYYIESQLDLADALSQMIPYIDGLVHDYLESKEESVIKNTTSISDAIETKLLYKQAQLAKPNYTISSDLQYQVMSINELPFEHFEIPDYQRPYKWNPKHVNNLINDLLTFRDKKQYRLGTLVLNENKIVDGQQRIVTLSLLLYILYEKLISNNSEDVPYKSFLEKIRTYWQRTTFENPISIAHVRENITCIRERVDDLDEELLIFLLEKCQFVVIRLKKISEAFQFFDSQNARGKDLEPHDLLKAFHLREISKLSEHDKHNISLWQDEDTSFLVQLFLSMYRVNRWSRTYSGNKFTKDDIDVFKGISLRNKYYPYYLQQVICHYFINDYVADNARMVDRSQLEFPFQLDQVCINGSRFFDMVRYYGALLRKIKDDKTYEIFGTHERSAHKVISFLNNYRNRKRRGDIYARELFDCVLLYYIDRFGFNEIDKAVWKLFKEVYQLRLSHYSVKLSTINKFAMEGRIFTVIRDAQTPFDIINLPTCQIGREQIATNIDESKDELLKLFMK